MRLIPILLAMLLACAGAVEKKGTSTSANKSSKRTPAKTESGSGSAAEKNSKKGTSGTTAKSGSKASPKAGTKSSSTTSTATKKKSGSAVKKSESGIDETVKKKNDVAKTSTAAAKTKGESTARASATTEKPQDNSGDDAARGSATGNASLNPNEIAAFDDNSIHVQQLLKSALHLAKRDLTYRFGSADPRNGGMDCSGTVYYLLRQIGFDPPRDSTGMYLWAKEAGTLRDVQPSSLDDPSLRALRPGDLLFWEGTYNVRRDPPISHVMIFLGHEKTTGKPVMIGASDGRSYRGKRRNGVSVFDFKLPRAGSTARFVAYGRIPGMKQ